MMSAVKPPQIAINDQKPYSGGNALELAEPFGGDYSADIVAAQQAVAAGLWRENVSNPASSPNAASAFRRCSAFPRSMT
jgi:hypothetical protein